MIYTKTCDRGTTSLPTGERVAKQSAMISYYGMLDELSSRLGLLAALLREQSYLADVEADIKLIEHSQQLLFRWASLPQPIKPCQPDAESLEHAIDDTDRMVGGLFKGFVLPGGDVVAAQVHVARCNVRRFERELYALMPQLPATVGESLESSGALAYVNRLSDFLYAMARKVNYLTGNSEKKAHL